jgi:hypothetical protein
LTEAAFTRPGHAYAELPERAADDPAGLACTLYYIYYINA